MLTNDDIADWRAKYDRAYTAFVRGVISHREASDILSELRYRSDALIVEMLEWEKARSKRLHYVRTFAARKLGLTPEST